MAKNKHQTGAGGFVFSTDPDFRPPQAEETESACAPSGHTLRIWLQRGKGGKDATVVRGFQGSDEALAELAKLLKNKCAAGGSAKDGEIIVQGDHRDKVLKILLDLGYRNTKKAGG
ncbi:MAG: translation initiation factor [Saprospiraceae bacterium]